MSDTTYQDDVQAFINKELGKGVLIDAATVFDSPRNIINTTPCLDIGLHGGVPEGTIMLISGPPKSGKTSLALQIAANAQTKYDKFVYYGKAEGRLQPMNLAGIHNFQVDKMKVLQSTKGNILSAEKFLAQFMNIIKSHPGCVAILDSASGLCSEKELTDDLTGQTRSVGPKLLASFCRQMSQVVPVQDSIIIIIQHLIANTSGYGSPFMEDGGNKIQFQSSIKVRAKKIAKWIYKESILGQSIDWEVVWCALGAPGAKVTSYLRYGYGFDNAMELAVLGCDLGLINKSHTWYEIQFLPEDHKLAKSKLQGLESVRDFIFENNDVQQILYNRIKEMT